MRQHEPRPTRTAPIVGLVAVAALAVAGCGESSQAADAADVPVSVVEIEGTDVKQLTLSERAAGRLGVETGAVSETSIDGESRLVVPYAALLWDSNGNTWVYTVTGPLTYARDAVVIDRIDSELAVLSDGPVAGTEVVTVGVAELHGVEAGVGGGH